MGLLTDGQPLRRIGSGAMGEVWSVAYRGRRFAFKWPLQHTSLWPEAMSIARMGHAHIVPIYDVGVVQLAPPHLTGQVAIAMPLANQGCLSRGSARDAAEVKQIALRLLGALAHCHARQTLHLDLKPANILVHNQGAESQIWLADFGTGQHASPRSARGGTLGYAAPEQAAGEVDARTDLFALGVTLWELLTGLTATFPLPNIPGQPNLSQWCRWLTERDLRLRPATAAHAIAALNTRFEPLQLLLKPAPPTQDTTQVVLTPMGPLAAHSGSAVAVANTRDSATVRRCPSLSPSWGVASPPAPARPHGLGLIGLRQVPFVGRSRERDTLYKSLCDAQQHGPKWVNLRGPGGVGKRTLARWLGHLAYQKAGIAVLEAKGWWLPTLLATLDLSAEDTLLHTLLGTNFVGGRANEPLIIGAVQRVLNRGGRGLVVLVDGQDAALRALFEALTPTAKVLVVDCSASGPGEDLVLHPLEIAEVVQLLHHRLPLSNTLAQRIARASGGDPSIATQLLHNLHATGSLTEEPSGLFNSPEALVVSGQPGWRGVVSAIAPQERRAVALCALMQPVDRRLLQRIRDQHALSDACLQTLTRRGLVRLTALGWVLQHPLFVAALCSGAERELHSIAAGLVDLTVAHGPLLAARHWLAAGDKSRCLQAILPLNTVGMDVATLAEGAQLVRALRAELQHPELTLLYARVCYATGNVAEMNAVLASLPANVPLPTTLEATRLELTGLRALIGGDLQLARQIAEAQEALALTHGQSLVKPLIAIARLSNIQQQFEDSVARLDEAEHLDPAPHLLLAIRVMRANAHLGLGNLGLARAGAQSAIDLATEIGSATMLSHAYSSLGDCHCAEQSYVEAESAFRRAILFCDDRLPLAGMMHNNLAYAQLQQGAFSQALSRLEAIDTRLSTPVMRLEQLLCTNIIWALCALTRIADTPVYIRRLRATRWELRPLEVRVVTEELRAYPEVYRQVCWQD